MSLSKEVGSATSLLVSDKALHLMLHGISGSVAGVLSTLVLYPIDNIKTRLQAQAKGGKEVSDSTEAESPGLPISNKPKTAIEIFKEILEKDGALGLYKGMLPAILGTLVTFGVYFFWYELFKGHFIKDKFSLLGYAITALLSGLITTTCNTPFSVLHTRMLLEKEKMHGLIATIKSIVKKEGPEGLFKGIGASYVLVANPIIQFVIYEYLKKTLKNSKSSAMVFILGALSKSLATMATYPYSTLKTNIQAKKHSSVSQMEMLKKIYENSGLHGFYRGFGTKMYQTVLNSALMLVIYERVQDLVKKILLAILSKK